MFFRIFLILFLAFLPITGQASTDSASSNVQLNVDIVLPPPSAVDPPPITSQPPVVSNVSVFDLTDTSASISWTTASPAICQVSFGQTVDQFTQTSSQVNFSTDHQTRFAELEPDSQYSFQISCKNHSDNEYVDRERGFKTKPQPEPPLINVFDFSAMPGDEQVYLTWKNPGNDFDGVLIVRNDTFYPSNPTDGVPIYEGPGTSTVDAGLINGFRYYYAAFAYDKQGNFSSGVVDSAIPKAIDELTDPRPSDLLLEEACLDYEFYFYDGVCHEHPRAVFVPEELQSMLLDDFQFNQDGVLLNVSEDGEVVVKPETPLTVFIDADKIPGLVQTILFSLEYNDQFFTINLTFDEGENIYSAVFIPPDPGQIYPMRITIFDQDNGVLKSFLGRLKVLPLDIDLVIKPIYQRFDFWLWILLIFFFFLVWKRRKKKKEEESDNAEKISENDKKQKSFPQS